nr:MAG TPA: hypothetical protein [Caudoviricetes sp.]
MQLPPTQRIEILVLALEEKVLEAPLIDIQKTEKMELEAAEVLGMDMVPATLVVEVAAVLSATEEMVLIILTKLCILQPLLDMVAVVAVQPTTRHQILRPQAETVLLLSNGEVRI